MDAKAGVWYRRVRAAFRSSYLLVVFVCCVTTVLVWIYSPRGQLWVLLHRLDGQLEAEKGTRARRMLGDQLILLIRSHPELRPKVVALLEGPEASPQKRGYLFQRLWGELPPRQAYKYAEMYIDSAEWPLILSGLVALTQGLWDELDVEQRRRVVNGLQAAVDRDLRSVPDDWDVKGEIRYYLNKWEATPTPEMADQ
jgi:hypothetical protein